ncbi:ABC transporter ATP-binding protein [Defluviimonas sp. WL0024]|uniref:ABC transporter ATP-binding protein n=2 Tax=Albidovulum TaxID=205889 RepID=A0ABT3J6H8_9RHOB|nr:ABC transporter ATP-binding protein [Defluviimonas sp. WL0024]MCU9849989.1 ABC transporter ATP-binding protein [Defluviimonas sp. WL0024]MCW3783263.1 ABC transporter ATP-binding protein [Defluviimonas salinarum]
MIDAHELSFSVRNRRLLSGVTLGLKPGETLGLVGPNGSGKSTLLRLLAGLTRPEAGAVRLDGAPLASLPRRTVAQRVAFVAQAAETAERLTGRQVVELGRTPWLDALAPWSEADESIVDGALATVEMLDLAERQWGTLSGGERQRLHIARALAQRPDILLLDEPTNHLDIRHQLAILRLVAELPVTSVIALHDLNQARICDRIAVLHQGRLVALGPAEEVLTPDRLRAVFGVAARELTDPADGSRLLHFHAIA